MRNPEAGKTNLDAPSTGRAGASPVAQWLAASLSLAPLAAVAYLVSEWLFIVTKPTPTAALPLATQLVVLLRSPGPAVLPLLTVQVVASLLSLVAYPRFRGLAVVPAAGICGFLLLVLVDNFTYTLFSIGIIRAGEILRIAYTSLLAVLIAIAGWKLHGWFASAFLNRGLAALGLGATAALVSISVLTAEEQLPKDPDAGTLPTLSATKRPTQRPNILFLGVDGVEADMTSAYGYERPTTPFLEAIRGETLMFDSAFTNAARTHGSLVALLTGRLPFTTRVTFPPSVLQGDDATRTLPALLKPLGYTTLQLGMRHYADPEDTNLRGFDAANYRWQRLEELKSTRNTNYDTAVFRWAVAERIDERLGQLFGIMPAGNTFAHVEGKQIVPQWRDDRRVATMLEFFRQAPEPWFVHLHLLDTHCCEWKPDRMHFSGQSRERDARDSQVRESDDNIRRLFEGLEANGQLERTIVVVSSDHASLWRATERVPLMMRFPNREHAGRVATNVQLVDVAPTMLDYLGVDRPEWMDGQSLLSPEHLPVDRPIFAVSNVTSTGGPRGARVLRDARPPNYGVSAVMMVKGSQLFELAMDTGQLRSRRLRHAPAEDPTGTVSDAEARQLLLSRITEAGLRIEPFGPQTAAAFQREP